MVRIPTMADKDWQTLVTEQIPGLRRYARALVRDRDRADDLVQDALERACGQIDKWQPGTNLRAWLFTIMHNLYVNSVRKYIRESSVLVLGGSDGAAVSSEPMVLHDLVAGLNSLPEEYREILLLAGLEQLSYREISEVLDIPLGTVMSRLSRARERLKNLISEPDIGKRKVQFGE